MRSTVVDASVAIKWFLDEPLQEEALFLLNGVADTLIAPDFLLIEVANAFWKRVSRGEIDADDARIDLAALRRGGPLLYSSSELVGAAFTLAERLHHPVYDCLYLALALQEDIQMVTADRRFYDKVAPTDLAREVWLLGEADRA